MPEQIKVAKNTFGVCDHWPVMMTLKTSNQDFPTLIPSKNWNRKLLNGHSMNPALLERWKIFSTDSIETEEDLHTAAETWVKTLDSVGEELGILKIPTQQHALHFDLKTLALIKRARRSRKKLNDIKTHSDYTPPKNNIPAPRWRGSRLHRTVQLSQGRVKGGDDKLPCFSFRGDLEECNLLQDTFLMAIWYIKRNMAPGKSGVLAMNLKKFLEVECQLQTTKDWNTGV
ncbi:hypothetical protein VP01_3041g2 [Puccinia sorghi]|uniref:Uncharacterized protein n=1 Tax=Puccinia sorghi TaxID=27349 RepID=A0A0L6V029_9BASI|nr:hypothetical protein VP01_3041g2 [Puccinia sorghi]